MPKAAEQLFEQWQTQQDEQTALSLCETLEFSRQRDLIDEVGKRLAAAYASSPTMLLAIARMYLRVRRLGDAQGLLVAAGRISPKNGEVYRWLGEVLLRRGDANRASKVLERAVALGRHDQETAFWLKEAQKHVEVQEEGGPQAVVLALAKVLPPLSTPPGPPSTPPSAPGSVGRPPMPLPGVLPMPSPVPPARSSVRSPRVSTPSPGSVRAGVGATAPLTPPPASRMRTISLPPAPPPSRRPAVPPPLPTPQSKPPSAFVPSPSAENGSALPAFDLGSASRSPLAKASSVLGKLPSSRPPPHEVLQALAHTGVFETSADGKAAWAAAPRARVRFSFTLALLTIALIGAGAGFFVHMRNRREQRAAQAAELDTQVSEMLRGGHVGNLDGAEARLSRSFDLEPNNPDTALLWVRDRVFRSLATGNEEQGIDSSIAHARQAGVPEAALAFARVASFLAQNDTAGAIALLPQWDSQTKDEPYYQLLAGAALERAGDARAVERYQLATKLDPNLAPAQVLLARALLLRRAPEASGPNDADRGRGNELAQAFERHWPGRAEAAALRALGWAKDSLREELPPDLDQVTARRDELPIALKPVTSAVVALRSAPKNAADARTALEQGLLTADTPGMATWLGSLALRLNEESLARRAALRAIAFSAVYPPARILAARVALAQGRIDEAVTAMGELEPTSLEVAIVRSAAAYERLDASGLDLAFEALAPEWKSRGELAALAMAPSVLRGVRGFDAAKLRAVTSPEAAWGDLVAVDVALDNGNLGLAKDLLDKMGDWHDRPSRALRVARYLRYLEKTAEAEEPSQATLPLASPRVVTERCLLLLATGRGDDARTLLAKHATSLGPMGSWLGVYIDAEGPRSADARAHAALLDMPPSSSPLVFRVLAALALADVGDRRRGAPAVRALARDFPRNPDVLLAQKMLRR
jgi:predicted Zn-dependent protease